MDRFGYGLKHSAVVGIALLLSSCGQLPNQNLEETNVAETSTAGMAVNSTPTVAPEAPEETAAPVPPNTGYDEGLALAAGAVKLGQQAQSPDDWDLVVSRWQRAIERLKTVPAGDPNHATAQAKVTEYERNLAYAQAQLERLENPPAAVPLARPAPVASPTRPAPASPAQATASDQFQVPIVSRSGGSPVILVTFNDGLSVPMILDTGASGTLITRDLANQLGLTVTGQTLAATASDRAVPLDLARVNSMTVNGITRTNVTVAVGDAIPIGLLGNDFHQGYDISIRASSVEFIRR
ncbi:MAG: aspartyl protease family protein [Cyanobacteria bacterium J06648_16]